VIRTFIFLFALSNPHVNEESFIDTASIKETDKYFLFEKSSNVFINIEKSATTVDSLLSISSHERDRNLSTSYQAARQAYTIAEEISYAEGLAEALNLMGIHYLEFGDHEMALAYYLKAIDIESELGNDAGIANLLNNISIIYLQQENYSLAAEYLESSIDVWKMLDEEQRALIATNNLGVIHRREGNYDKALDIFWDTANKSLLDEAEPDSLMYIIATLNIGNTYRNKGNFLRARIHLNTAKEYIRRHGLTNHLIFTKITLGKLHLETGNSDRALHYGEAALELAKSQKRLEFIKESHELIAKIYEVKGDYKNAYAQFQQYHIVNDSLQSMQRGEKISELHSRFDVENMNKEIDLLVKEAALQEAKIMQQDQLKSFLLAGMVLLTVIIVLLIRANRQKKETNIVLSKNRLEIENQYQEVTKLHKEKDEFMSIAAHDLRNPLSSINMAVDLINADSTLNRKTLKEYTDLIKISSDRMLNLINNVLHIQSIDYADRIDAKKLDVNQIIDESVLNFNKVAENKNISLQTVLDDNVGYLLGETDKLIRIFDNLISNAIKYSPRNTTVILSTKRVDDMVRITVRDQGPGISKEDQKKLFSKFSRLKNKPTGNETSTGLGLFIVKKLCESLHGKVWCESEPGCGSTFYVMLPAAIEEVSAVPPKKKSKTLVRP